MEIRPARPADHAAIDALLEAAFGRPDEAALVMRLRAAGDVALELVAGGADPVGHILLSPMTAPFPALGLAPLAVLPAWQGKGIGTALARAAIARARTSPAAALFVLGDPAFYGRLGFRADRAAGFTCHYACPHFMVLPLKGDTLPTMTGEVGYAAGFGGH